jgi:aryl-alcohol dehydrogenase-like predicted oxidoreductase
VVHRRLGRTGRHVSPIGFGAFKIGRNQGIKYASTYALPDENEVAALLDGVLEMGINLIDTAPAYGLSEERIGRALAPRRHEFVLSTKAGELFEDGRSTYDFTSSGIRRSVQRSLRRLRTDFVDLLLIHSDGNDVEILERSEAVATVLELRDAGLARAVGFSGKTVEGARAALVWADVIMVEYHAEDRSHDAVIAEACAPDIDAAVLVKKGLASGRLAPEVALPFILENPNVASVVIGGLNLEHLRQNVALAGG